MSDTTGAGAQKTDRFAAAHAAKATQKAQRASLDASEAARGNRPGTGKIDPAHLPFQNNGHAASTSIPAPTPDDTPDPFDLARLRVSATSDEALGVERPLLNVPVTRPSKQSFFRAHPDPEMTLLTRVLEMKDTNEFYLLTQDMAAVLYGESKLVALTACLPRQGGIFIWPVPIAVDGDRENAWHATARQACELAKTKWVRMQANRSMGQYDVVTSTSIPDPHWPSHSLQDLLRIAFGGGRLVNSLDHPVVRALNGQV